MAELFSKWVVELEYAITFRILWRFASGMLRYIACVNHAIRPDSFRSVLPRLNRFEPWIEQTPAMAAIGHTIVHELHRIDPFVRV